MKEHLRKKRSDLDSNFSSLKAFFKIPYTTPIGRKAITAAKFLIATTLLLAILFFSSQIIAQDEFSMEQAPSGDGNEFGIMTDISTCSNITSPGIYNLTASISGSSSKHCISINTSDVVLDGQGFQIDGTDSAGSFGIYVMNLTSATTNITLRNVNIRDWVNGIYFNNTFNITIINSSLRSNTQGIKIVDSNSMNLTGNNDDIESDTTGALEIFNLSYCSINKNNFSGAPRGILATDLQNCNITNNNISRHTQIGISTTIGNNLIFSNNTGQNMNYFLFYNVSNSTVDRNNFTDNSGISAVGIITQLSHYNNITNNNLSRNNNYGLELIQSNYTFVSNNTMNAGPSSPSKGIYLNASGYNMIVNNIANSNYYGFSMNYSHYNNITNNTFNNNNVYGISMISDENNVFTNNTFNNNSHGIFSKYSSNNLFTNNIIDFNNRSGIFLVISDNNYFWNNTARSNNVWDVNISGYNNTFTNLTIGPIISFLANNISLRNASAPANDPNGAKNISKWINATNTTSNAWLFLNISYTDAEISGLNENNLAIVNYKTSWETTTSVFANPSGVVTNLNYVFANISSFSIFVPMDISDLSATDVNGCTTILVPGVYSLTTNITNSALVHCIRINTSNVVFDGQGFTIDGTDTSATYGVFIDNRTQNTVNVTLKNVYITDWGIGALFNNTINSTITNVTFRSNNASSNGYGIRGSSLNLTIQQNRFDANTYGILSINITESKIEYNNFTTNTNTAIDIKKSNRNNITNNNITNTSYLNNGQWGIRITDSNSFIIDNNFISSNGNYGIDIDSSNYTSLTNNIVNNQVITGIFLNGDSFFANVTNNTANQNGNYGMFVQTQSRYNNITNNTIQENGVEDLWVGADGGVVEDCQNIINNNLGSGNRSILYFNSSTTIQDQNISELILCGADNSSFININISGSQTLQNNGLYTFFTDNSNFTRILSSDNYQGQEFKDSYNNTITNSTTNNNSIYGIHFTTSSNNIISESNVQYNGVAGILLATSNNNLIYNNILKYNLNDGLFIGSTCINNTIVNNTANYNGDNGIELVRAANNTIVNNTANYNSDTGISLFEDTDSQDVDNNTIEYNIAMNNTRYGLRLGGGRNNTIKGNYFINNTDTGIYMIAADPSSYPDTIPHDNLIINNTINSNTLYGIYMFSALNNTIINNTINGNRDMGIYSTMAEYAGAEISAGSPNNLIVSNVINYNLYGVYLEYNNDNQFYSNVIDSNNISGIELLYSNNNTFVNNTARNNTVWDVNLSGYYSNTFINLTIGPIISFTAHNISLKNATGSLPTNPGSYFNINKYINLSNISANAWIFLNISYTDSEIGALDESTFIIARHNSSWETTTSRFANPSGVIVGLNYVFANITDIGNSSSIFAPFGPTAVADSTNPVSILMSPANNTFRASSLVDFNCSATDETALSNVTLVSNINGSWSENLTYAISGTSNQTNLTVNGIVDGTYIWNCLGKDTSNNQAFNSTNYTITIDTTDPLDITLNSPEEAYSSTDTVVIFNFSATDNLDTNLTCNVTLDNSIAGRINVSNGTSRTTSTSVSVGSHQWNVTCYDNALNSNTSITRNFTITSAPTSPSTGSGGSSGGGGGTITPPAVPPEPEPEPIIEEPEPVIEEPEPENIFPVFEPILDSAFEDIIENSEQLELVLGSRRTEKGVEILFGGKGKLQIEGGGKRKIKIDLNDESMTVITGRYIEPLNVKSYWWILFVILIILTHGSVHRWFKEYGVTITQADAIKQLKTNLKESDKKPNQDTLDKSWTIFSKYIVTELKVKRATLNTLLYAIIERDNRLGPDFYDIFEELWQKKGKNLTKEDLKKITKKMIKLIKRLG